MTSSEKKAYQRAIAAAAPNLVPQQLGYELGAQDTEFESNGGQAD